MKYIVLDKEEEQIIKAFEEGKLVRIKNFEAEKKKLEEAARNTLNKTKNINIRLSERTLTRLKVRTAKEGLPYQTLAASVLHKFVNEKN